MAVGGGWGWGPAVCWEEKVPFSTCGPQLEWNLLGATTLSISPAVGLSVTTAGALMDDRQALGKSGTPSVWLLTHSVTSERSL